MDKYTIARWKGGIAGTAVNMLSPPLFSPCLFQFIKTRSHVTQAGLELLTILLPSPKCFGLHICTTIPNSPLKNKIRKFLLGAREMDQRLRAVAVLPEDLDSVRSIQIAAHKCS